MIGGSTVADAAAWRCSIAEVRRHRWHRVAMESGVAMFRGVVAVEYGWVGDGVNWNSMEGPKLGRMLRHSQIRHEICFS